MAPLLDDELAEFYNSLLRSESRHFMDYLKLARQYAKETGVAASDVDARIAFFAEKEAELIQAPDSEFRFHSGPLQ